MLKLLKRQSPVRIIALGFLLTILLGSVLLKLPISVKDGQNLSYIDALYTSTSAVCVTGLISVDVGATFTLFGRLVVLLLVQVGGLGVTTIGAGIILAIGRKMDLKGVNLIKEASNLDSGKEIKKFIKSVFLTTITIELIGAVFSFFVFVGDMPALKAIEVSIFHSVASFNNSGFDILASVNGFNAFESLTHYANNVPLNLITSVLIILGGIGFLVIKELLRTKFKWKKLSMHTKVVLTTSVALILAGTILLKLTEGSNVTMMQAVFMSVSSRTAGFTTINVGSLSLVGLLVMIPQMFIGASPGSTGGGIKTTTFFTLILGVRASISNKTEKAFKYSMPKFAFKKASVVTFLAMTFVFVGTFFIALFDPTLSFRNVFFEAVSAFGTVGLTTGITPSLSVGSKIVSMLLMFVGRLGPLTIASLAKFSHVDRFYYPEGNISIG